MGLGLQLSCAAVDGATGFHVIAVGGDLQFMDVGASVLVKALVLALGDGERAGAEADGLPGVEPLRVVELQYQSGQTTERPRAETHGDVGGKPCHEVAATPVAGGPLALVSEDKRIRSDEMMSS